MNGQASVVQCPYCPHADYEYGNGEGRLAMQGHMRDVHGIPVKETPLRVTDAFNQELRVLISCETCAAWRVTNSTMNDALIAYGKHCQEVHPQ